MRTRLHPLAWPAELNSETPGLPRQLSGAFIAAQQALADFNNSRKANAANNRLSPAGIQAANAEWDRGKLPDLERRIEDLATEAAGRLAREMEALIGANHPLHPGFFYRPGQLARAAARHACDMPDIPLRFIRCGSVGWH